MKLDIGAALADALAIWRQNSDLLLRVGGVFFFLPLFATGLFRPDPPLALQSDQGAGSIEATRALFDYYLATAPYVIAGALVTTFGAALLYMLFQRERPRVGEAMGKVAALFLPLVLALIGMELLVFGGTILFIIPGLYAMGRTFLVGIVVIAERRTNPIDALGRSIELTRGHGWILFFVTAVIFMTGLVATSVIGGFHDALLGSGSASPVFEAIFAAATAAIGTVIAIAEALIKIAIYRRMS
ncbi:hypothetical protein [Stakelama marina]|uniref:Glycerophosphoryl diester phosphodiesterase membrane domain-containing protein n=1 Tax=Stakelama marina TaxID=2826939 RepID=A0A8T4IGF5_9SPHN|nr:hypothetical protein [Stakelama marina]MBR0553703.1 hypothetical protein [Stakelama marina]